MAPMEHMETMGIMAKNNKQFREDIMEEKGLKITLATIQSFLVILLAYLLSFVKETEIVNTSIIILFILHFFIFYKRFDISATILVFH